MTAPTLVTRAAELAAENALTQPGGGEFIASISRGLREKRWDRNLTASLGQPSFRGWTAGEIYAFGTTLSMVYTPTFARVRIEVGSGPERDSNREGNAALLSDLPAPFVADLDMDQNGDECDGSLGWEEDITMSCWIDGRDQDVVFPANPNGVRLEVGSCNPSTVKLHLVRFGAVARWAYESPEIWLFVGLPTPAEWVHDNSPVHAFVRKSLAAPDAKPAA